MGRLIGCCRPAARSQFRGSFAAAQRLSPALERRPLGSSAPALPILTRHRLSLALRAVDVSLEGNSYREIAQGLFGKHRTPDRGLKNRPSPQPDHSPSQTGLPLM